jgi:hypothetical protein
MLSLMVLILSVLLPLLLLQASALTDMTNVGGAHGSFLRQGPDGKGGIACLPAVREKRVSKHGADSCLLPNVTKLDAACSFSIGKG